MSNILGGVIDEIDSGISLSTSTTGGSGGSSSVTTAVAMGGSSGTCPKCGEPVEHRSVLLGHRKTQSHRGPIDPIVHVATWLVSCGPGRGS